MRAWDNAFNAVLVTVRAAIMFVTFCGNRTNHSDQGLRWRVQRALSQGHDSQSHHPDNFGGAACLVPNRSNHISLFVFFSCEIVAPF